MADVLDSYTTYSVGHVHGGGSLAAHPAAPDLFAQSFTVTVGANLTSAEFRLWRSSSPVGGTLRVRIYDNHTGTPGTDAKPTGSALATSDTLSASSITSAAESWFTFNFTGDQQKYLGPGSYFVAIDGSSLTGDGSIGVAGSDDDAGNGAQYRGSWETSTSDFMFVVFGNLVQPVADFSASPTSGATSLEVAFTDLTSNTPTSWSWYFGDTGTSTDQNPTHTYTTPGTYTVELTATNDAGSDTETKAGLIHAIRVVALDGITGSSLVRNPTFTQSDPPPPPPTDWTAISKEDEKVYVYKVYEADGTYIGIWPDVSDDLRFTQRINTPGTTTTVKLARSANTTKEARQPLTTEAGDTLTTEDGDNLVAVFQTPNSVGEDTDVDLNYNVDVYVHYGEFVDLLTEAGEELTTEAGDNLLVSIGAPLGTPIFRGFIMDYESGYGEDEGVTVTLSSHGIELSNEVVRDGDTTTVSYSTTAIETIVKDVLDTNPGKLSYDATSIGTTGQTITTTFQLNTKLEAIESAFNQTPDGWYWYGDAADNLLYMKVVSSGYDHIFILGRHIKSLNVKRSIESLINRVYFVGGDTGSSVLYKKYEDATSQTNWRVGLNRIVDRRYTQATSAQARADKLIGRYKNPIFTSPLVISSARYDIESIKLGQTVGFSNFGNFIDDLPALQIVSLGYEPTQVTLELGELQERQTDIVGDLQGDLANEQYDTLPTAPS